jgi:hypothetical protein
MLFDVAGRGAEREADRRQASRNQSRIFQLPDTKGEIKTFLDQIDEAVIERDIDHDLGIAREIVGEHRTELRDAERNRCREMQHAARRALQRARALADLVDLVENLPLRADRNRSTLRPRHMSPSWQLWRTGFIPE